MKILEEKFIDSFTRLVNKTNGYVSHLSALYFLGRIPVPPEEMSIVVNSRRPDKVVEGIKVRMICGKNIENKKSQFIHTRHGKIRISIIEQTLVDIVDQRFDCLNIFEISQIFLTMPFDLPLLLEIAGEDGDSTLKRVLFYLSWSGRGSWKDFPAYLNRTPVKLHSDLDIAASCWCNRLFIKFPKEVLKRFPEGPPPKQISSKTKERISLARFAPFRDYFYRKEICPVFDSPGFDEDFEIFCKELLENEDCKFAETLFDCFAKEGQSLPILLQNWVIAQAEAQLLPGWLINFASEKIESLLNEKNGKSVQAAVAIAIKLNLYELLAVSIVTIRNFLAKERRYDQLEKICSVLWQKGLLNSIQHCLIYLSSMVMAEKNEEALELISTIRKRKDAGKQKTQADLAYYKAVIHNNRKEFDQALEELNKCGPFFQKEADWLSLAAVEFLFGSANLVKAKFKKAREAFLRAYKLAKDADKAGSVEIETLLNLVLLEFSSGNFQRCLEFGDQAMKKITPVKGSIREFGLLRILISAEVNVGKLGKAIVLAHKFAKLGKKIGSSSHNYSVRLIQSWLFELLGQTAVAGLIWTEWNEDAVLKNLPPCLYQPLILVKTTRFIMNGKVKEAIELLEKDIQSQNSTGYVEHSLCTRLQRHILKGLLIAQTSPEAAESDFLKAMKIAKNIDDCQEKRLLTIIVGSFFPASVGEKDVSDCLKEQIKQGAYDPFWFLYAKALLQRGFKSGSEFIHLQFLATHKLLFSQLELHYPFLRKIVVGNRSPSHNRDCLLVEQNKFSLIPHKEYKELRENPENLFFNSNSGIWSFSDQTGHLKFGSNSHKIFTALILEKSHRLSFASLFQQVWGVEYEAKIDRTTIISALTRLKDALEKISSLINLTWKKESSKDYFVKLHLKLSWSAIF